MEVDTAESVDMAATERVDPEMADPPQTEGDVEIDDVSSDESMGDEEEVKMTRRASELEKQVVENPYLYDAYKELITIYKTQGELELLREVRQRFSTNFPLTEELWLDWIRDEQKLVDSVEDRLKVIELFDKAVQDYISIPLWIDYCTFAIGLGDNEKCRNIMSQAISAGGYHLIEGKLLWDLRLEYEQALLETMQPSIGSCPTEEKQKLLEEQTAKVDDLYKQLIVTPLVGIQAALVEYEQWLGENISAELREDHDKAISIISNCNRYENELVSDQTNEARNKTYDSYITSYVTHHSSLTGCIRCLFERALAVNCLDQNLWIRYTIYLEKNLRESPDIQLSVYRRSLRNCPWSGALWVAYCLACEKQGDTLESLEGYMETALESGLQTAQDFLSVWSTYCDVIRRRIDWSEVDETLLGKLRAVFERAIPQLLKYFGEEGDGECILPKYWALVEAKHCKNMEKAREIWNDTMTGWRHNKAAAWLEYVAFERCYGDHKHCRRVFQRALKAVTDWPESICSEYVRFEREEGSLDQLYVAQSRVADVRDKLAQEMKSRKPRFDNKKPQQKDVKQSKKLQKAGGDNTKRQKQSSNANHEPVVTVYKRKRDQSSAPSIAQSTVGEEFKTPSIPPQTPSAEFKLPARPNDAPPNKKAKHADEDTAATDYSKTDGTTVFISNIAYDITDTTLSNIFMQCGNIKDVRIMKGKGDKSKGFAYVEFDKDESVASALALDRTPIEGHAMYVSPSNRQRTENTVKLKYNTGMEKCKLFVSGLCYDLTREQVKEEFAKHGKVKDVRIVTYKGGKSKGLAYVEFHDETDARKALMAMDGATLQKFTINVAISHPPARKPAAGDSRFVPSLGGVSKQVQESQPRGKARTQINLMPRVFQTKPTGPKSSAATGKPTTVTESKESVPADKGDGTKETKYAPKLSNADFRALLLSKK